MTTNYEEYYRTGQNALGLPGKLITGFFDGLKIPAATVLDIGCGQGRDALFIARLGHHVTGVDLSPTGISDMLAVARAENLPITGITADISTWQAQGTYDIILFDRTLHMLAQAARLRAFRTLIQRLKPGGFIFIADERPNIAGLDGVLKADHRDWHELHRKGGDLIVRDQSRRPAPR